jgi:hypothetical protein
VKLYLLTSDTLRFGKRIVSLRFICKPPHRSYHCSKTQALHAAPLSPTQAHTHAHKRTHTHTHAHTYTCTHPPTHIRARVFVFCCSKFSADKATCRLPPPSTSGNSPLAVKQVNDTNVIHCLLCDDELNFLPNFSQIRYFNYIPDHTVPHPRKQ